MTVAEYMELRCLCGLKRSEHIHTYADLFLLGDVLNPHPVELHVVGVFTDCKAFTWEFERELTGHPLANKHLRALMVDGD